MNNKYELVDGSPRYGSRSEDHSMPETAPVPSVRAEEAAQTAAGLGLDHLAAAIDRRLTRSWSDKEDPLLIGLRKSHPEDLGAARAMVKQHLGSQRQWRLKAQAERDKHLAATRRRRRDSGSAREILFLRLGLLMALIAPPAYVAASSKDDILKLLLTGNVCIAAAFLGGHLITVRARVPVMPNIPGPWLNELREDVVNATLVSILQNNDITVDPRTAAAARRRWQSIVSAAKAVDALQS